MPKVDAKRALTSSGVGALPPLGALRTCRWHCRSRTQPPTSATSPPAGTKSHQKWQRQRLQSLEMTSSRLGRPS